MPGRSKRFANGLTALQENFCRHYLVCDGNATVAFKAANPASLNWQTKTVNERASRMLGMDKVRARIAELQARATERAIVSVDTLAKELDDASQLARDLKQPGVVVSAITVKARMYGLIVDKKEIRTGSLDNISVEELKVMEDAINAFSIRGSSEIIKSEGPSTISH